MLLAEVNFHRMCECECGCASAVPLAACKLDMEATVHPSARCQTTHHSNHIEPIFSTIRTILSLFLASFDRHLAYFSHHSTDIEPIFSRTPCERTSFSLVLIYFSLCTMKAPWRQTETLTMKANRDPNDANCCTEHPRLYIWTTA